MNETMSTYCPTCDAEVEAVLCACPTSLSVKGKLVSYVDTQAICPVCGETIGDARVEGDNLERAFDAYRAAYGTLSPT